MRHRHHRLAAGAFEGRLDGCEIGWFGWDEALALADPGLAGGLGRLRARHFARS